MNPIYPNLQLLLVTWLKKTHTHNNNNLALLEVTW